MKQSIQSREDRYYNLFNHYLDASIILDYMTCNIIAVNDGALRFLRRHSEDLVGHHLSVLLPADARNDPTELMEQIRMFGHANTEWKIALGSRELAETQIYATAYSCAGNHEIMLTLRAGAQGRQCSEEAETKIQQLRSRIDEMKRLNYELNNPLQQLISVLELHWGQSYHEPIERITRSMGELRSLCSPPGKAPSTLSRPRTVLTNDNRVACTKNRILIVDDESSIRTLFNNILRQALPDATLDMATDGPEAIRAFEQGHHELIIIDNNMPKMTGERVLRSIEEFCRISYWRTPAVILCTGYDPGDTLSKLKTNDQTHSCLLKPVSRNQLLHEVQEKLTELSAPRA